jgi:hypothetical protein
VIADLGNISLAALTALLTGWCRANIADVESNPALAAEFWRRLALPPMVGFQYKRDEEEHARNEYGRHCLLDVDKGCNPGEDTWSTFAALLERHINRGRGPGDPILDDCDGLAPIYGAAYYLRGIPASQIELRITQPEPGAMAHAYLVIGGGIVPVEPQLVTPDGKAIVDACVMHGMDRPPDDFYLRGQTGIAPLCPP